MKLKCTHVTVASLKGRRQNLSREAEWWTGKQAVICPPGAETLLITSERCGTFIYPRISLSLFRDVVSPRKIIWVIDWSGNGGALVQLFLRRGEGEEPWISQWAGGTSEETLSCQRLSARSNIKEAGGGGRWRTRLGADQEEGLMKRERQDRRKANREKQQRRRSAQFLLHRGGFRGKHLTAERQEKSHF